MKIYLHFLLRQFGEKLRHLVRRDRTNRDPAPPAEPVDLPEADERPRRRRLRYTPVWVGNQILPLPLFEEQRDPARDFYEDT